ncbi:TrbI F-type domain-containing protein [Rubrivivax gelatinosus]|uniref:TrbI F-type domain-containing protein n=1 Tax=Rubrivivax gelatinosus TaxID=28068 RepID=UPI000681E155|nr:TrbI F-type domain-containing protein [Rubrivivax gelatinosus]MBG6083003.1 Skp family chaperone for outer membrane proteins [Rubrivivax gelatinosus]
MSVLQAVVIAVLCASASGYLSFRAAAARQPGTPQIAFLDTARIASTQLDETLKKPGMTPDQARAAGQKFVADLDREMQRYTDAGIVVVNSSVVVNNAPGLDITQDVAAALGVQVK